MPLAKRCHLSFWHVPTHKNRAPESHRFRSCRWPRHADGHFVAPCIKKSRNEKSKMRRLEKNNIIDLAMMENLENCHSYSKLSCGMISSCKQSPENSNGIACRRITCLFFISSRWFLATVWGGFHTLDVLAENSIIVVYFSFLKENRSICFEMNLLCCSWKHHQSRSIYSRIYHISNNSKSICYHRNVPYRQLSGRVHRYDHSRFQRQLIWFKRYDMYAPSVEKNANVSVLNNGAPIRGLKNVNALLRTALQASSCAQCQLFRAEYYR